MTQGLLASTFSLAGVVSSLLSGWLFDTLGPTGLFTVMGFLALALKPDLPQRPATPFGALMVLSFSATTVGYGGAAWSIAHAIIHTAS